MSNHSCCPAENSGAALLSAAKIAVTRRERQILLAMLRALLGISALAALSLASDDPSSATYNFLTMADWGADDAGQYATAAGMGDVAAAIDAKFVFALGDNFYTRGIQMPDDGEAGHLRFNKTFESVYTAPSLRDIPFYAVAGNHDHFGNVTAQIEYTNHPQNAGGRWQFPYWYYNVTRRFEVGGKEVELEVLLFDSVVMLGNTDVLQPDGSFKELKLSQLPPQGQDTPLAQEQLAWLKGRMENSTADYLWVGGHYPVWAIGQDPPTGVNGILRGLLNEHEAQYFNGHEHDFEHLREEGTKVNYICTGAGK